MPIREFHLPTKKNTFLWRDYEQASEAELDNLGTEFQFHPLAIEDAKTEDQRSKVESYDSYLFLSLHTVTRTDPELNTVELEVFISDRYIITTHRGPLRLLDDAREHYLRLNAASQVGPDFLLYLIADLMVDAYFPILDAMDEQIDALEDEILESARTDTLGRLFQLKQQLIRLRKTASPMREVLNALASTRFGVIDARTAIYFRDVYDHLIRIYDFSETSRDLLSNALDTYLSVVSNRLNDVMKRLTVIATIFLPISFLAGLGGMNFERIPFENELLFWALLAAILILPVAMLVYFRRKGWY